MLNLYKIDMKYVRNLMNIDHKNILSVSSQHHKNNRLFVGVIVMLGSHKYCIPLSSVEGKSRFETMAENMTMRKIKDSDGNVIGILNINNMIPVRDEYISKVDVYALPNKTDSEKKYRKKCIDEYEWLNNDNNEKEIRRLSEILYTKYVSGEQFKKRGICANFPALEKEYDKAKDTKPKSGKKNTSKKK